MTALIMRWTLQLTRDRIKNSENITLPCFVVQIQRKSWAEMTSATGVTKISLRGRKFVVAAICISLTTICMAHFIQTVVNILYAHIVDVPEPQHWCWIYRQWWSRQTSVCVWITYYLSSISTNDTHTLCWLLSRFYRNSIAAVCLKRKCLKQLRTCLRIVSHHSERSSFISVIFRGTDDFFNSHSCMPYASECLLLPMISSYGTFEWVWRYFYADAGFALEGLFTCEFASEKDIIEGIKENKS